jgi:predicted permease
VRLQLGASRSQVFFQLLAENLGLVFGCGIVALLVAAWMTSLLHAFFPISGSGALLDHRSIGLLAGIALVAAALSAIVPAAQTARGHLSTLWRSGHAVGQARSRLHHLLLIGQITFAMVLVTGAGLFVRSLHNLKANVGYDLERVIAASVDLERAGIRRHLEKRAVFDAVLQRLEQLPGVAAVGLSTSPPLGSGQSYVVLPRPPGAVQTSLPRTVNDVSPGYFESLGTRLLRGRAFSPEDGPSSAPVAIVDQGLASELWPGEDPVGTCKQIFSGSSCFRIVGISEPRRLVSLTRLSGEFFLPLAQRPSSVPQSILIRASESAGELVPQVAAAIRQAAANGPFVSVRPLVDMANVQARSWRLGATMFALFASIAIVLAVVGIYASLAAAVRQRTSEIGVRLTLGASPVVIALMVIRQGLSYVVAGWVLGTILSFALARSIEGLLFGVKPTDILTFTGASLLVAGAGAIGCAVPAWRAGHVDPVVALRTE